jgi:mannose-6-phosphate isomerase-like protein (cupin superfamily)
MNSRLIDSSVNSPINVDEKFSEIEEPWSPINLVQVNDQVVRIALFKGEYHLHKHENEDELFFVFRGRIVIRIKDQRDVELSEGEMFVVPKNIEHCPSSSGPSYVVMFEPFKLNSRGDS